MSERLKAAIAAREQAEADVARVLREEYPVGSVLCWGLHGERGNTYQGRVEYHGYRDRLIIRTLTTKRTRRIVASYIQS